MISVANFLPDCWETDSMSNLLVREQQADGKKVTEILIAITYTENGKLFDLVKALYDEFIIYYQKESVPLLKDDGNALYFSKDNIGNDRFYVDDLPICSTIFDS